MSKLSGSTQRSTKAPFQGQQGKCAWCGTDELPKGRKSWCSKKCVDEYLMRSSSSHIRFHVLKRDKGICAICGCDADKKYKAWLETRKEAASLADNLVWKSRDNRDWINGKWRFRDGSCPNNKEAWKFRNELVARYAPGNWSKGRTTGWDADHIVPVVEGGGECGLENYRTLCHPCHKDVTAELAKRRAKGRRKTNFTQTNLSL